MTEQVACAVVDLDPGSAKKANLRTAEGVVVPVAIVRDGDGEFHAIGDTCTHDNVSLSEGEVVGDEVECWAHGSRFSFTTGQPRELPAVTPVPVYALRVEDGRVLVDVDVPLVQKKESA